MFDWITKTIIGTKNQRELRKLRPLVGKINSLESWAKKLSAEDFPATTAKWKDQVQKQKRPLDELLPDAFALVREAAWRTIGQRHFDVQLIGGMILHKGRIAEMKTGEGKTLTATLPCFLNALEGRGVHVVTVNDYLARRDAEWMGQVHKFCGLTVGCILNDLTDRERQVSYGADITYGQNNEFGFDYLRDNMKVSLTDCVQRELNFAIVDEVDSILIDEARTPLIISGPSEEATDKYYKVDAVIPGLIPEQDYVVDEKARSVMLSDDGVEKVEKRLSIANLYDPDEIETLHHVEQALRAHTLYRRDTHYMVKEGAVLIVDEFTGRILPGRRWSDGLHQAIEAKEGVKIENENQTLATISFQNYFRMYTKLAGMTGTADTEAAEFAKIYNLDVNVIPTNRAMIRQDYEDVVYKTEREKFNAAADEIEELNKRGQPVLVGTVSIAKSEALASILKRRGVPHNVLNAKHHEREAEIVAQAGRLKSVTISTNMAGRGTDIILGGNAEFLARKAAGPRPEIEESEDESEDAPENGAVPDEAALEKARQDWEDAFKRELARSKKECDQEHEEVVKLGGLFILGTERHESRRVDNQLRGRAGRQGDPGMSRFYLSLEDDLMRIFGSDRIKGLMERLGMKEGEQIEHRWLTKSIESAQKRVEAHNFDIRKNLLEYDDVMNQQRKAVYRLRRQVLAAGAGAPLVEFDEHPRTKKKTRRESMVSWNDQRERILDLIEETIIDMCDVYCPQHSAAEWDTATLTKALKEQFGISMSFAEGASGTTSREELEEQIWQVVSKAYEQKEKALGVATGKKPDGSTDEVQVLRLAEKKFYLDSIDALWKDHLLSMDHLRQGIGLRGYGQRDPKEEYKKEGYEAFIQMMRAIRASTVRILMRLEVRKEEAETELAITRKPIPRMTASHSSGDGAPAPAQKQVVREAPKVGRNDPCPCGSGKKYKKCHGQEQPVL
jgi:preprotein translocase subunit SecA